MKTLYLDKEVDWELVGAPYPVFSNLKSLGVYHGSWFDGDLLKPESTPILASICLSGVSSLSDRLRFDGTI